MYPCLAAPPGVHNLENIEIFIWNIMATSSVILCAIIGTTFDELGMKYNPEVIEYFSNIFYEVVINSLYLMTSGLYFVLSSVNVVPLSANSAPFSYQ